MVRARLIVQASENAGARQPVVVRVGERAGCRAGRSGTGDHAPWHRRAARYGPGPVTCRPGRRLPWVIVTGPLAPLLELAGVPEALTAARTDVDAALRHPALRAAGGTVAAEVALRSAVASAALEGHGYPLDEVRAGTVTDPVVQGALRVSRELDDLAMLWTRVPRQVLARVHVLAARDVVPAGQLGRPVPAPAGAVRLATLLELVTAPPGVPAMLLAAVVHAELVTIAPFAGPGGVVARLAARLCLVAGGLDPRGLLAPEVGHLDRRPEYVGALGAFATGTPDGLRAWLRHYATAISLAAAAASAAGDVLRA